MEKLPMCRICLAEDVRMYVVVTENLHELYERLTDIPFVTNDGRPILACSFCCAELQRSFRLLRRCLEAEELFAQIMNGNYKQNPLIKQDRFAHGFIISPIQNINIVEVDPTESVVVKEELPAVCEKQDDILEPKEEAQGDDLEVGNLDNSHLDLGDILPHDSESDSKDDVLLMEYKIEEEEEQETSKEECRAVDTNRSTVAEKPKLHLLRSKSDDPIPAEQKTNQVSESTVIQSTQNHTSRAECKKPHKCDVCLRNFTRKCDLKRHERIHTGENDYKCDICEMVFRRKPSLRAHIRRTHTGSTVAKKATLHLRRSESEELIPADYTCEICQSSFTHESSFTYHKCTGEKLFKCDICNSSFYRNNQLINHIRIHTGEKPYKCDICQRSFTQYNSLARHGRTHTGEKPYKCHICQRSFAHKVSLDYHIRTHTGEKPYKCDTSQKSFIKKAQYKKPHECNFCLRKFRKNSELTRHLVKHTGEKPYTCDICQRRYTNRSSLAHHMRRHTGVKPYKCDMCQKSFSKKVFLTHHMRTHTGEKPYKCDICQRSFSQQASLVRHNPTQCTDTGGETCSYKCDVCPYSFRRKGNLIRHIRTHTDEKPNKESSLLRRLLSNTRSSICHEGGQKIQLN